MMSRQRNATVTWRNGWGRWRPSWRRRTRSCSGWERWEIYSHEIRRNPSVITDPTCAACVSVFVGETEREDERGAQQASVRDGGQAPLRVQRETPAPPQREDVGSGRQGDTQTSSINPPLFFLLACLWSISVVILHVSYSLFVMCLSSERAHKRTGAHQEADRRVSPWEGEGSLRAENSVGDFLSYFVGEYSNILGTFSFRATDFLYPSDNAFCKLLLLQEQLLIQIETMRAENEQGRSRSNSLLHGYVWPLTRGANWNVANQEKYKVK